jgi:hypothetical protein
MVVDAATEVLTYSAKNPWTAGINVFGLLAFSLIMFYFQAELVSKLLQRLHTFGKIFITTILTIGGLALSAFFTGHFWYFLISMICAGFGALTGVYVLQEQIEEIALA